LCSREIAIDQDHDRATVVVHARLEDLAGDGSCEIEGGPVIHPETARRLACDCRLEITVHDRDDNPIGLGRASRTPSASLVRQLRHRDGGCTFPGCDSRSFLHAHHIRHWIRGGPTDPDNLVLACPFHHKLVHEYGWDVRLEPWGQATWLRPDGRIYDPAPPLPAEAIGERSPPALVLA